ncbi:MAG: PASTA domain-containing protein, partial [Actinomycetota bacterium]|nr:PASTA domain-containing protein [Actinomycetota bacterium]
VAARVSSLSVPAGHVISSDPPGGTRVETGQLVALTVSTGAPPPPAIVTRPPPRDRGDEGEGNNEGADKAEAAQDRAEEAEDEAEDRAEGNRGRRDRGGEDEGRR